MGSRRNFLKSSMLSLPIVIHPKSLNQKYPEGEQGKSKIKLSLNAYSFNRPLQGGSMSISDMLEFAADLKFDAVDLTAYYFPGYPDVPPVEYFNRLKREAFLQGLSISGTGIRTDFTLTEKSKIKNQKEYIAAWIKAAAQMGAPVIRVFAGKETPENESWDKVATRVISELKYCCELGEQYGVMIALQNHDDFIQTPEQCLEIKEKVNSKWFGLMVDIGSFSQADPYEEIKKVAQHAITWQIKEQVYVEGEPQNTDYEKIVNIINDSGYQGFVPLETLGEGDPREKVAALITQFRKAMT